MALIKTLTALNHQLHGLSASEAQGRLGYGSFLGGMKTSASTSRYLFMETPKAACSTMKWLLADLEGRRIETRAGGIESSRVMTIHIPSVHGFPSLLSLPAADFLEWLNSEDVVRFCVVRNPYHRVLSAWADKIRQREPRYRPVWKAIAAHTGTDPDECPEFRHFVAWLAATQDASRCNGHWRSMTALLLPDLINYTHVLRIENLASDLNQVLAKIAPGRDAGELLEKHRLNESLPLLDDPYNEEIAAQVFEFYREDFDRFGYSRDSWKTPSAACAIQASEALRARTEQALHIIRSRNDVIDQYITELGGLRQFAEGKGGAADLLREMGALLYRQGNPQRALEFLQTAAQLRPNGAYIHIFLARCLIDLGEGDAARVHLEVAGRDARLRAEVDALLAHIHQPVAP